MKRIPAFVLSLFTLSNLIQITKADSRPDYYYISGLGAVTWHRDMDFRQRSVLTTATQNFETDYRLGYGVAGSVGVGITKCWRFEIEGYFRNNEGKTMTFSDPLVGSNTANTHFHYRSFSLMANTFYDFCICNCLKLYIGGGMGAAWVKFIADPFTVGIPTNPTCDGSSPLCFACPPCMEGDAPVECNGCCINDTFGCFCPCFDAAKAGQKRLMQGTAEGTSPSYSLDDIRFAYQIMAGFSYTIAYNIDAIVGYRLWGTIREKNRAIDNFIVSEERVPLVSSLELGLRYRF